MSNLISDIKTHLESKILNLLLISILSSCITLAQEKNSDIKSYILSVDNFNYLKELTAEVVDSSRINPGQTISDQFWPDNTGGVLIRPGGMDCDPYFWIRDYAMSL